MSYQTIGLALVAAVFFLVKLASATDKPKIKNIPEIPGVPLFGNLIQLGTDHARVAAKWAKKYGPVFQTRLGTQVCFLSPQYLIMLESVDDKSRELYSLIHTNRFVTSGSPTNLPSFLVRCSIPFIQLCHHHRALL